MGEGKRVVFVHRGKNTLAQVHDQVGGITAACRHRDSLATASEVHRSCRTELALRSTWKDYVASPPPNTI